MSDYYFQHQELSKRFGLLATQEIPEMRIFNRHVGLFHIKRTSGGIIDYTPIKINKPGMADAYGIIKTAIGAIHIEIEFKSSLNAKQTKEQKTWEKFNHSMNGAYFLVRNERDGIEQIKTYIRYINGIIAKNS